jgi:RNA polymerase primary sigma factor
MTSQSGQASIPVPVRTAPEATNRPFARRDRRLEPAPEICALHDLIEIYFADVNQVSQSLTFSEEHELGKRIVLGRKAARELERDADMPSGAHEQLQRQTVDGQEALDILVTANLRLVASIAWRYRDIWELEDLIQEGNLGLLIAAAKWNPARGLKFSTFATWWIRQNILRAIQNRSRPIRLPVHWHTRRRRVNKAIERLLQMLGREPSPNEIAAELGVPVASVNQVLNGFRAVLSLDKPILNAFENAGTLAQILAADESVEECVEDRLLSKRALDLLNRIPDPRGRQILLARLGFYGEDESFRAIAARYKVTRQAVANIYKRTLSRLQQLHDVRNSSKF